MTRPETSTHEQPPTMTRTTVMQGQVRVSAGPRIEFSTVLGSCVASCMFDPVAEVGGMNHFLLAVPPARNGPGVIDIHYGVYLMELLINEMLAQGGRKDRLRAHLYGGANLHAGMAEIGTANAAFARSFLEKERIMLVRHDLGGTNARRIDFRPAKGQVRCRTVPGQLPIETVSNSVDRAPRGDVELF